MIKFLKKKKILVFIMLLFINLAFFKIVKSQTSIDKIINKDRNIAATAAGYNTEIEDPVGLRADYLKFVLSFLGVIFLFLIIYGGFIWMGAKGNQDEVAKAKSTIINAAIGLVIVLASYAVSSYIVSRLASSV